ncbi:hypothetical protein [Streptomyces monomycini]|uniref:nSTAND1 domain-containing NTPase n=1 Tax=Streptomyces monomycini TaxID=371720 RepID=UPI0031344B7C
MTKSNPGTRSSFGASSLLHGFAQPLSGSEASRSHGGKMTRGFDSVTVMVRNTADQAPYPGPARYGTGDQDRFFGRDHLIQQLLVMVRERPVPVLVGPSGTGESSLLRAGPIPNLRTTPTVRCPIRRRTTAKPGR